MFDDVHELLRDDGDDAAGADPSPPPFAVADTAAIATAAATLALANTHPSDIAASEHNVPAYQPPLRQRIAGFYDRHSQLTKKLEALGDIPAKLDSNQHEIFSVTGKVKSQEARLKTLQSISQETRDTLEKMSSSLAKRLMNKRGNRSRLLVRAQAEAEKANQQQVGHEAELEYNRSVLASKHTRKEELERELVEYSAVSNESTRSTIASSTVHSRVCPR